ncbi:MAG: SDR family oxidoreductase [Ruminococcaceae bacterium]|nr:SDR family oxidoreductase [Oscillospiraceae bacterium]
MQDIAIPNFDLKGKVAVITGGTKGIGYGIALTYANYGADVVVASRTVADCERVEKELQSLGVRAMGIPTDVSVGAQVDSMIDKVVEKLGRVDIMVANAGVGNTKKAVDLTDAEWDTVVDIDLKGVFYSARAAARQMIKQGDGGRVINVASAAGVIGAIGLAPYTAAKAGVVNMTKTLAGEWGRFGITVNALCPGYVATSINDDVLGTPAWDKIVKATILRRSGEISEIAAGALFLASDFSGFMTGATLLMDGGTTAL